MTAAHTLSALLACPRCDRRLEPSANGYACAGCKVDFPVIAGLPWLFAEPAAALGEWRGRLHFALRQLQHQSARIERALERPGLRALTRERLTALRDATHDHAQRLGRLLEPFDIDASTATFETYLALRTRLPTDQGLMTYYGNVHRDWAWGDEENAASLALVRDALGESADVGRTLVLGSGGGRLAYDLHQTLGGELTVALDFNPLLVLVAERVTRGEPLELYEFPLAPKRSTDQAVLRTLQAGTAARPGLMHIVADAHRPPFAKGSFDTVLTPWLIDILPEPLDDLAARVNHLLADGGRWVNFGSLSFHDADPALRYSLEECAEVLVENRFAEPAVIERQIPYLASPASRHARRETVVAWSARKQRSAKAPPRHQALPDWIVRGTEPVPLNAAFRSQIMATRVHAFIMSLIDGRRTLKDIARVLVEQQLMSAAEAEAALRTFLTKMHDDARRSG